MADPTPLLFFDLADPLSFAVDVELRQGDAEAGDAGGLPEVHRLPLEINPPPAPLLDPDADPFASRWSRAREWAAGHGTSLRRPPVVPWSRKAHELVAHATEVGQEREVREAVFDAAFRDGRDIGRVDVLVELAVALGLDRTRTRAVLDVDRHAGDVVDARRLAESLGVVSPPCLVVGQRRLEGFHNARDLRTFLV